VATLTSGTTYTFSCFGKFGALSSGFSLNVFDENAASYGSGVCQAFNLNEGTLGASGTIGAGFTLQSVGMEDYGNGWYRCRMTVLMGYTPTAPRVGFRIGTQITGRPASVPGGTVNAWGAQLETGSVATSYIPTTTGTVTRNADVVSVTGVSSLLGQTSGTFYTDISYELRGSSTSNRWFEISSATNNIGLAVATAGVVRSIVNGLSDILITPSTASGVKIAWGYDGSGVTLFVNGTQYTLTNGGAQVITALDKVLIDMSSTAGTRIASARIRAISCYQTRLPNTTTDGSPSLQSITTL
jgi:hypothetical protein